MTIHEKLVEMLENMGVSFTGYADIEGKLTGNLQSLHYAVTIGIRLSDAIIDEIADKPTYTYFHHYRTVNALLDQIALRGMLFIQQHGFNALAVPASQTVNNANDPYCGIFPHKTAAVMAGLGRIGKNGLFIHNVFGPRVRLATILTDMELPCSLLQATFTDEAQQVPLADDAQTMQMRPQALSAPQTLQKAIAVPQTLLQTQEMTTVNKPQTISCSSCNRCVEACPAMALTGREWHEGAAREEIVDAKACSDYMNKHFKHIGRGSVCGICVKVCPAYVRIRRV